MVITPCPHLGLDLDNTLINYDQVFLAAARAAGLLEDPQPASRVALRTLIRAQPDGERRWQQLQAEVYARRLDQAQVMPGAREFLGRCHHHRVALSIVSHKTRHAAADPGRTDLRALALDWLEAQGLLDPERFGLTRERVHFTDTRPEKLHRIAALDCTHFVDDLPELLADPAFPLGVQRLLFAPPERNWQHLWQTLQTWLAQPRATPC
jgi:hypothetical protein